MRDIYNLSKICFFVFLGSIIVIFSIILSKKPRIIVDSSPKVLVDITDIRNKYITDLNSKYEAREEVYSYWDALTEQRELDFEIELAKIKSTIEDAQEVKEIVINKELEFISKLIFDLTKSDQSENFAILITDEAKRQGVDPLLVTAVILAESTFKIEARSKVGAIGLMQLMPRTAQYISELKALGINSEEVRVPEQNIKLGVTYLREMNAKFKDLHLTLVAYNWGPGALSKALKNNSRFPKESLDYSNRIRKHYYKWKAMFNASS